MSRRRGTDDHPVGDGSPGGSGSPGGDGWPDGDGWPVDDDQPVSYKAVVEDRILRIRRQIAALEDAVEDMRLTRSLTFSDDEHDPDGSTVSLDQARDTALLQQTRTTLELLIAARHRLLEGRFGSCESCGQEIPDGRLRARPEARFCVTCAGRSRDRRPAAH